MESVDKYINKYKRGKEIERGIAIERKLESKRISFITIVCITAGRKKKWERDRDREKYI